MEQHEHFSDEALLRHLDGEAAPHEQHAVIEHLKACWMCRANLAELERQIHVLARSQREASFPGPGWPAEARWKFLVWRDKQEALSNPVPSFAVPPPNGTRFPAVVWPVACVAIIVLVAWAGWQRSAQRSEAREVLTKARIAEEAVYRQPVHQDFRVMISGQNSESQPFHGRLQIWSDPDHNRLSAKLTSSNGAIRHGVWRAEAGEEFIYDSQASSQPSRREAPVRVERASAWGFASDAREIEEGFIRWMDSRQWEPIAVSDAELLLAGLGGVLIRVETAASQPDVTTVRAEGADGRFVELTIDTSEGLRRPRVRKIRLAHPSHSAELVLITDRAESFAGTQFHPAIFRPDPSLYQREVARTSRPQPTDVRPNGVEPAIPQPIWPPKPSPGSSLATKIEVYYALHEVGACLGEPIHVISTDLGITVEGLVETNARKNELLRVLDALPSGNPVLVEIRSVSEMPVPADPIPNGQKGQEPTLVRAQQPPIQQSIRSFLQSQAGKAERGKENLGQRATRLSSDAVRWSASLMVHTWSLRRLTDALSAEQNESLTVRSRVLVENMVADHLRAMRGSMGSEGRQVTEFLSSIQGRGQGNGAGAVRGQRSMHRPDGPDSLFESVSTIDGMVRMLFAGDFGAAASGSAHQAAISNTDPTASAAVLLAAIQHAGRRLDLLIEKPLEVVFQENAVTPQVAARAGGQEPGPKQ
jgi:hypothetical protein